MERRAYPRIGGAEHGTGARCAASSRSDGAVGVGRFQRREGELLLVKDVLDRQVIDVRGTRVVRVNDLYLSQGPEGYRVVALDTGGRAILRRILPAGMRGRFEGRLLTDWRE